MRHLVSHKNRVKRSQRPLGAPSYKISLNLQNLGRITKHFTVKCFYYATDITFLCDPKGFSYKYVHLDDQKCSKLSAVVDILFIFLGKYLVDKLTISDSLFHISKFIKIQMSFNRFVSDATLGLSTSFSWRC